MSSQERVYLKVPYVKKDVVKERGARWDPDHKRWWISKGKRSAAELMREFPLNDNSVADVTPQKISLGAVDKETAAYVPLSLAQSGQKYICPDCSCDVFLKNGQVRARHFAHIADTHVERECRYFSHPGESAIHREAKYLLEYALNNGWYVHIRQLSCTICGQCGGGTQEPYRIYKPDEVEKMQEEVGLGTKLRFRNYRVRQEHAYRDSEGNRRVIDVAIVEEPAIAPDEDSRIVAAFEIRHTHRTEAASRKGINFWYEFDATDTVRVIQDAFEKADGSKTFRLLCLNDSFSVCWMCEQTEEDKAERVGRTNCKRTCIKPNSDWCSECGGSGQVYLSDDCYEACGCRV